MIPNIRTAMTGTMMALSTSAAPRSDVNLRTTQGVSATQGGRYMSRTAHFRSRTRLGPAGGGAKSSCCPGTCPSCLPRVGRKYVHQLAALAVAELHHAGSGGEERVVAAAAHVLARVEPGAALAD